MKTSARLTILLIFAVITLPLYALSRDKALRQLYAVNDSAIALCSVDRATVTGLAAELRKKGPEAPDSAVTFLSLSIALDLYSSGHPGDLIGYVSKARDLIDDIIDDNNDNNAAMFDLDLFVCDTYRKLEMQQTAIYGFLKLLDTAREHNWPDREAVIYNNIASIYQDQHRYNEAISLLGKSIAITERLKDRQASAISYNNIASAYLGLNRDDKAIEYSFVALHLLEAPEDSLLRISIQRNISTKYESMGEYSLALKYLTPVIDYYKRHNMASELPLSYKNYAAILQSLGRNDEAAEYFQKAYETSADCPQMHMLNILRNYASFCHSRGDTRRAYSLLDRYARLNDSITTARATQNIDAITKIYDSELHRTGLRKLEYQRERKSLLSVIAVVSATFMVILGAVLIHAARSRRRLRDRVTALSGTERELRKLITDSEHKEAFITSLSRDLAEVHKAETSKEMKRQLHRINSRIYAELKKEKPQYYDVSDDDFCKTLLSHYPNLTVNDIRLCRLLTQGLSTKEIAEITCKEVRSIDTARNRLRKKCGISPDEDLCKVLNRLK